MKLLEGIKSLEKEILKNNNWGRNYVILRNAFDPSKVRLNSSELKDEMEIGLLRWPYFSLVKEGKKAPKQLYTKSRNVIGHQREDFIDKEASLKLLESGYTLKLNRLGDWETEIFDIKKEIENNFPVAVSAFGFLTPGKGQGLLPHRDASHVIVAQIEGVKEWQLYKDSSLRSAEAGLIDLADGTQPEYFELSPGDLLYFPQGMPHFAKASTEESWHLTFTLEQPTIEELLEQVGHMGLEASGSFATRWHHLEISERVDVIKTNLIKILEDTSSETILQKTLRNKQEGAA